MSVQNRIFIVTGANGHLGSALIRLLKSRREEVRGLVLPGETVADGPLVRYFQGDVTKKESLRPLFEKTGERSCTLSTPPESWTYRGMYPKNSGR